jgi:hypothetical protein
MKLTTLAISALIALLAPALARGQMNGFPPLPPVPQTGQLPENPSATKFTFIVAGDNRPGTKTATQPATLSQLFNNAQSFNPAFFLWCGDTISGHTTDGPTLQKQYEKFISAASKAKAPLFNAPGNHEMDTVLTESNVTTEMPNSQMLAFYLQYMRDPANTPPYAYGAFNYGNSRFIAMNTEEVAPPFAPRSEGRAAASGLKLDPGYVTGEQIELLKQDLAANQGKDHIFVFMHHPIKPKNSSSGLDSVTAANLAGIFSSYSNVSYVLAAHEHLYYNANSSKKTPPSWTSGKSQPPIYLVTGGAGAPLDKCGGKTANTYCGKFFHYLVFTVDGPSVSVQLVELPTANKTSTKKNGGKK